MKKISIFVFLFFSLVSCGKNMDSQNISLENSSENTSYVNNISEKVEDNSENNVKSQEDEEFDARIEYEKYARGVISEIVKLPESERTKKVGNFEFIIEKDGIRVKYFNKNVNDYQLFDYEAIINSVLIKDSYLEYRDNTRNYEAFQKCVEQGNWCHLTKEEIFDNISVYEDDDFEGICLGGTHISPCTAYLFDAQKQILVDEIAGKTTRDGDFLFVEEQEIAGRNIVIYRYYPHRNEYLKILDMLFDDEYQENGVSSLEKFTLTKE